MSSMALYIFIFEEDLNSLGLVASLVKWQHHIIVINYHSVICASRSAFSSFFLFSFDLIRWICFQEVANHDTTYFHIESKSNENSHKIQKGLTQNQSTVQIEHQITVHIDQKTNEITASNTTDASKHQNQTGSHCTVVTKKFHETIEPTSTDKFACEWLTDNSLEIVQRKWH